MYSLFRTQSFYTLAQTQTAPFVLALVIAEFFFKFGSFTLECLGFLATWFVLDAGFQKLREWNLRR